MDPFWHYGPFFWKPMDPIFLETYSPHFFQRIFLIVLGPLEISADKVGAIGFQKNGVHRFPEKGSVVLKRVHSAMLRLSLTGLAE